MEVRLNAPQTKEVSGRINPKELTPDTFPFYCRLYLIENIYKVIPATSEIEYKHVSQLIHCISPILFKNLKCETNKILLLNEIYSLFMELSNEAFSREFLYGLVTHIASYDPELYYQEE